MKGIFTPLSHGYNVGLYLFRGKLTDKAIHLIIVNFP
jgi:hypothetical protein